MEEDVDKLVMRLYSLCDANVEQKEWPLQWWRVFGVEDLVGSVIYDEATQKYWVQCPYSEWWDDESLSSKFQKTCSFSSIVKD